MINKEQEKLDEWKEKDHENGKHWKWQTWVCSNAVASCSNEISERKKKGMGEKKRKGREKEKQREVSMATVMALGVVKWCSWWM